MSMSIKSNLSEIEKKRKEKKRKENRVISAFHAFHMRRNTCAYTYTLAFIRM